MTQYVQRKKLRMMIGFLLQYKLEDSGMTSIKEGLSNQNESVFKTEGKIKHMLFPSNQEQASMITVTTSVEISIRCARLGSEARKTNKAIQIKKGEASCPYLQII